MRTESQVASWWNRWQSVAARVQVATQNPEEVIQEWAPRDLPANLMQAASVLIQTAQGECNERRAPVRFVFRALSDDNKVLGQTVSAHEPDATELDESINEQVQQGGLAATAFLQLLRHKEAEHKQAVASMQWAVSTTQTTLKEVMADRQASNTLMLKILEKLFELKLAAVVPEKSDDEMTLESAKSASMLMGMEGLVQHVFPKVGEHVVPKLAAMMDDKARTAIEKAGTPKRGRGRPRTNGKAQA